MIFPMYSQQENMEYQVRYRDLKIWSHFFKISCGKSVERSGICADLIGKEMNRSAALLQSLQRKKLTADYRDSVADEGGSSKILQYMLQLHPTVPSNYLTNYTSTTGTGPQGAKDNG